MNANASGTIAITTNELEDTSAGLWQVSASGATLQFDTEDSTSVDLSDDFEVSNGTLDINAPEFVTTGALTFTGGTIDCANLTGSQVAKFTGIP